MSKHTMEKPIAEQMLDWAERLDKRLHAFNKQSLYDWLVMKAPRVAELEQFNVGLDGLSKLQDEAFAQLESENEALMKAITDGRLTHTHFRTWADALVESQGYSGSEIEWLCSRLADTLLTKDE